MSNICVNARSMSGFVKRLTDFRHELHNQGKDTLADRVYELEQDCLFDNYLELSQAKHRLVKILS
jgi:hypothetical protein